MPVTPDTIEMIVNGELVTTPVGQTVRELLDFLGVRPDRVALELNRRIVHQRDWDKTSVDPGAQVEIVEFVGGG
jgi:sulfur carrier protein